MGISSLILAKNLYFALQGLRETKMGLCKMPLTLVCFVGVLALVLVHPSHAQNSQQDYLDVHNAARAEVGVEPMTWDDNVAAYAMDYATQRSGDCNTVHSNAPYGENLAAGSGDFTATDAVNMWVGEKSNYDHNSNSCVGGECGHYTQVVWRDSVTVGCARVQCNNGWWFVSCNYSPQGNIIGNRPY